MTSGRPSVRAMAWTAATCPCGTDRVIVTAPPAGTSCWPFSPASIKSMTWPGRLARLGFSDPARSYAASYRQAQVAASEQLPATLPARQRAYQLLRRHGQVVCRRKDPSCSICPISDDCPSADHPPPPVLTPYRRS
jgi:hypothetical protein